MFMLRLRIKMGAVCAEWYAVVFQWR